MYLGDLDHVELSVPNLTSPLASTPRKFLIKEVLRPYITSDNFLILVKRVKDLGFFLGTFICHSVSEGKKMVLI